MAVWSPACTELSAVGVQAQGRRMSGNQHLRGDTAQHRGSQACLGFTAPFQTSLSLQQRVLGKKPNTVTYSRYMNFCGTNSKTAGN